MIVIYLEQRLLTDRDRLHAVAVRICNPALGRLFNEVTMPVVHEKLVRLILKRDDQIYPVTRYFKN